jgi:hypothetical protein
VPFPLERHLRGICPLFCLGSFHGEGSCPLIDGGRAWQASCLSPASVVLVGARPLLVKRPLEEFRRLRRLGLPAVESPASCWRSRPFGRSWPLWPNVMEIPGTSAGRWLCPWPTRIVIPMTPSVRRLQPTQRSPIISNTAGTAPSVTRVDGAATASSTRKTPTILMIVGWSRNFMKKMESSSVVGVAVAMARVDRGATAATMTGTRVATATVHHLQIPSRYHCLR